MMDTNKSAGPMFASPDPESDSDDGPVSTPSTTSVSRRSSASDSGLGSGSSKHQDGPRHYQGNKSGIQNILFPNSLS